MVSVGMFRTVSGPVEGALVSTGGPLYLFLGAFDGDCTPFTRGGGAWTVGGGPTGACATDARGRREAWLLFCADSGRWTGPPMNWSRDATA
jgi:hypothetical protein